MQRAATMAMPGRIVEEPQKSGLQNMSRPTAPATAPEFRTHA
jgi:hypothetical protein